MKNLTVISFLVLCFTMNSQSLNHKNNITFGGGKTAYNGDLGNSWFTYDEEWYGFFGLDYTRYLTKEFDLSASISFGDYGRCKEPGDRLLRTDGTEILNMLSRLTSLVVTGKYKLDYGYFAKENSRLSPFITLGAGLHNVTDYFWECKNRVNKGNYASLNAGLGLNFDITKSINFSYTMRFGYFLSDDIDKRDVGDNDKILQHYFSVGKSF